MFNTYMKAIKRSYYTIRFELYSHVCCVLGFIKTKMFFDRFNQNKLEIGIGTSPKKHGFISSDINLSTDYPFDLRLGLPFPDASIDFIYAEHVLEHFNIRDLNILLADCFRVLKKNGSIRVSVPDASIYLDGYFHNDTFKRQKYCYIDFGLTFKTKLDYVNYIFYMDGHHRYMFDKDTLLSALSAAHFGEVQLKPFDPGLDQEMRHHESIYAEAKK
jgi:SAM-dependent methyltransferase